VQSGSANNVWSLLEELHPCLLGFVADLDLGGTELECASHDQGDGGGGLGEVVRDVRDEVAAWPGPTTNRFGKPWTWRPCSVCMPSAQCSESVVPSLPTTSKPERRV